jgi:hypothetical protein
MMKRILLLLPLTLAAASGCLMMEGLGWKQPGADTLPVKPPGPPPGVQPEEVNEGNAAAKLEALRVEIEYDANDKNLQTPETPKSTETPKP